MNANKKTLGNLKQTKVSAKTLFYALVLFPTIIATLYYGLFCTERYVTTSTVSIRSPESSGTDLLQSLTGMPSTGGSGSIVSDSYAIEKLILSNDLIESLPESLSIETLYGKESIDYFSRLTSEYNQDQLKYWEERISINIDALSNLMEIEVQAYEPEEALKLNEYLIQTGENYVNELSERLRNDAISLATREVNIAKANLLEANQQLAAFIDTTGKLSFEQDISSQSALISSLESQLADKRTELAAKETYLKSDSNSLITLRGEISAIEAQIASQKQSALSGSGNTERTSEELGQYNQLMLEKTFAEEAYASARASLESSRIDASTQERYLVRVIQPNLPDETTEPGFLIPVASVFLITFLIWALLALIIATVKEHMGWVY
ncbi:MAG: hypothetical protein SVC26_04175 [Pseudomonadota bacterium]|nr:hypothetical protein [Pseudomonadota bacterium]